MITAEIRFLRLGLWTATLVDSANGSPCGERWEASSRSELIGLVRKWIPLSHLIFRDVEPEYVD